MADGDEQAADGERRACSPVSVSRQGHDSSDLAPWSSVTAEFQAKEILGSFSARRTMILLARSSPRRWTMVTDRAKRRQEGGLLDRGVATADDGDVLVAEEEAVAGRAPRDAVAGQPVLVGEAELAVAGAGRQDHGTGGERRCRSRR